MGGAVDDQSGYSKLAGRLRSERIRYKPFEEEISSSTPMDSILDAVRSSLSNVAERRFRVSVDSFIVLTLFSLCCVLIVICVSMLLCCRTRRNSSKKSEQMMCKKGIFSLMFARLEEFDSLTPLIVTPANSFPPCGAPCAISQPQPQLKSTKRSQKSPLLPHIPSSSTSPPPPRRLNASGKTLIVPLNASKYRLPPAAPLLGTPDSRVTSFETGTTKSCATIPEDDEESPEEEHCDLISIDRTSVTCSTDMKSQSQRYCLPTSSYNLQIPMNPPNYQIPAPTYAPPEPPLTRPCKLRTNGDRFRNRPSPPEAPSTTSSSLGSSGSSVGSGGSPIDTTGSLSDSFYLNHDLERLNNLHYEIERCFVDSDSQSKFHLHRIDEESEQGVGVEAIGTIDMAGNDAPVVPSKTADSLLANRSREGRQIPRSISEQFEMLRQQGSSAT